MAFWRRALEDPVCGRRLDPREVPFHEDGQALCSVACLALYRQGRVPA